MGQIALIGSDLVTIVDDEDHAWLASYPWRHFIGRGQRTGYAKCGVPGNHNLYMHRLILNAPIGVPVDHVNGDGLYNKRANIRLCTDSLNSANSVRPRPASGFRGVYKTNRGGSWHARIGHDSKIIGLFYSPIEAAIAFDAAARIAWGSFARLNFPRDGELAAFPDEVMA
jgi:hypothetical protein